MGNQGGVAKTYCIIGDPVDHSLSPAMHNAAFKALNMNCVYIAFRIKEDELEAGIGSLKQSNIAGFNVTMPHKVAIMKFLNSMDETCAKIDAVNTVNNENGKLRGYNTDMHGFIQPIRQRGIKLAKKNVLLIGAGGAARAVLAALADENVAKVIIANRSAARAGDAAKHAGKLGLSCDLITLDDVPKHANAADLIVNATPIGMTDNQGIKAADIRKSSIVYDLVYTPMETSLLKNAKEAGATVIHGYEMLVEQGAKSFEIWHGIEAPRDVMRKTLVGEL